MHCGELRDGDGQPVMLMAVADGHGGRRYRRSEEGSRLACETAVAVVGEALASRPLGEGEGEGVWSRWLAHDLPEAVQRRWLEAVRAHWRSDPGEGDFEPLLYGSTLGLVVMTPLWWGHTGLGDWDLVRVEADGHARLLQEENELSARGEATCSLCQPQAASLFARRAALHPIAPDGADFALVLCTDGIRKSCATDADFLTLAAWLARSGGEGAAVLPEALDRISRDGSGDDVTVAIGRIGATGEPPWPPPVPPASTESPAPTPSPLVTPSPSPAALASRPRPLPRRRPAIGRAVAVGLALAAAGAGWLALVWPRSQPPPQAAATSPGLRAALAEVERLCGQPSAIPLELRRRRDLFVSLRQGRQDPARVKAAAATDPLAALIAADLPDDRPPADPSPAPRPAAAQPRDPLQALGACPALRQALGRQWALTPAPSPP